MADRLSQWAGLYGVPVDNLYWGLWCMVGLEDRAGGGTGIGMYMVGEGGGSGRGEIDSCIVLQFIN